MIEAEWWEYDDEAEFAEAVAGDVAFIIESALDARGQALVAFPGGTTPGAGVRAAGEEEAQVEERHDHPDRRSAGARSAIR